MSEIKAGSVVKLKSGGPEMTVQGFGNNNARCSWFVGGENKEAAFNIESLEVVTKPTMAELGKKLA